MYRSLIVIIALSAAACGGGGEATTTATAPPPATPGPTTSVTDAPEPTADAGSHAEAIATAILREDDAGTFGEAGARCFGESVVGRLGSARLDELGLSIEEVRAGSRPSDVDLSESDLEAMADAMVECIDFAELLIEGFVGELDISQPSRTCLQDRFAAGDLLRDFAKASLRSDDGADSAGDAFISDVFAVLTECLTPTELNALFGS